MSNSALFAGIPNRRTVEGGGFGGKRRHKGRDSVAAVGTPVYGAGEGVVVAVENRNPVYGYRVEVAYKIGNSRVIVGDGHLSKISVRVGDQVTVATKLGESGGQRGSAGAGVSTAPHLHEDTTIDGVLTDPDKVLNPRTATAGDKGTAIPDEEQDNDMLLSQDIDTHTYWLITSNGRWVVPNQEAADKIYRVQTHRGNRADHDYLATLLASPPWTPFWQPVGGGAAPKFPTTITGTLS